MTVRRPVNYRVQCSLGSPLTPFLLSESYGETWEAGPRWLPYTLPDGSAMPHSGTRAANEAGRARLGVCGLRQLRGQGFLTSRRLRLQAPGPQATSGHRAALTPSPRMPGPKAKFSASSRTMMLSVSHALGPSASPHPTGAGERDRSGLLK